MTSLVEYINSWLFTPKENNGGTSIVHKEPFLSESSSDTKENNDDIVCLISVNDLLNVKLKPVKDIIPSPARNMPVMNKFQLHMLNQAQLKEILKVKLRPTPPQPIRIYEHRHPVLREMLEKVKII